MKDRTLWRTTAVLLAGFAATRGMCAVAGSRALSDGIAAVDRRQWNQAMEKFFEVLHDDPGNSKAHAYINLVAKQLELERQNAVRESRLSILANTSKRLEANHEDASAVDGAILDSTQAEERAQQERWHAQCEQARMERELGHLLLANDLVLKILSENPNVPEAQRELSELQSRIRQTLDHPAALSIEERYAYEGLYAFGQADYRTAATAWQKLQALLAQSYAPAEAARHLESLHIASYVKTAQSHMDAEKRETALRDQFERGLNLYKSNRYSEALDTFRQLAIQDPDYPQLGTYLVLAEGAAEKDRARRLGEQKRQEIANQYQKGIAAFEREQFAQAQAFFEKVLALDPSHTQAKNYLAMAKAEMERRHDPKAAQAHYEAGLIAYASGRLDEAAREWKVALRLNAGHEKAANALAKVQRELAMSQNVP